MNLKKLKRQKTELHKKLRVKDERPGALIERMNRLPKPKTKLGIAVRGLI